MGIFDFFTGSDNKVAQSTTIAEDSNIKETSLSSELGAASKTTGTISDVLQTQNTLDADVQAQLADLITQITGATTDTTALDFAKTQATRAEGANADLAANIQSIIAGARSQGEQDLGRRETAAATKAGSSFNSVVQALGLEGRQDFEKELAGLAGNLNIQARQAGTQEFSAAGDALSAALKGITGARESNITGVADLADVLKGATSTTTSSTEQQSTENSVTQLVTALQKLAEGKTVKSQDTAGSSTDSGSLLDIFRVLLPGGIPTDSSA